MESATLLQDLAVVMAVAAVITIVCHRFHLPVVLGYIVAGVIVGPHTPPYSLITDLHRIHTLSELGVVFLLFSIGLEFSFSRLLKVGFVAFAAATFEIFCMIGLGYAVGRGFGWSPVDSLFLGAILSISSTTIIAKILLEMKRINEPFAQVVLGILIIEDVLAIVIIAILSGLATSGTLTLDAAGLALGEVAVFVLGLALAGFMVIPRLLRYLERQALPETLVISVLGLCFAGALAATKAGFSVALGAFIVGAIIAETRQAPRVIQRIEPIRDMFTAVFFVAVGMMIQPSMIAAFAGPILLIALATIVGKVLSCSLATFLSGYTPDTALLVGVALAQIGEFSFIIAGLGESTGVTSQFLYPIAVSVSAITTLTTPLFVARAPGMVGFLERHVPRPAANLFDWYTASVRRLQPAPKPASKTQERIERVLAGLFDLGSPSPAERLAHDRLARLIREEYPWEVETADLLLPFSESAVNTTISELRLRNETGATIAAIYRDTAAIPNPASDIRLMPGDVLLLMGDKAQVKAALAYLQQKIKEPA